MYSSPATVAQDVLRFLLVCSLAASLGGCQKTTPSISAEITTLDNLDAREIPAAERFAWQPKEVVAVIGSHRWRHWGGTNAVAFSPDGTTIASGGNDGFVRLWDKDGREITALNLPTRSVNALAFRPDGRVLLTGGEDGMIHAWDLGANPPAPLAPIKPSALPERPFGPPGQPAVDAVAFAEIDAIAFAPGGKLLAHSVVRQAGERVVLWDSTAWPPRELPALPGATPPFAFSADGTRLVTQGTGSNGNILVWDLTGERPRTKAAGELPQPRKEMLTMALAPDGKTLATCHGNVFHVDFSREPEGDVILWDLTLTPPKPKAVFGSFKFDPLPYMTTAAAFSPDGKTLAFAARQRRAAEQRCVEVWDVTASPPKKHALLPGYVAQTGTLAFAPDGKTLASVGAGVLLWDMTSATPHLKTPRSLYSPLAVVSPGGRRLATAGEGTKEFTFITRLWDLTGPVPQPLSEPNDGLPLFFGSDGILLTADNAEVEAAAAEARQVGRAVQAKLSTLRRWNVSGKESQTLGAVPLPPVEWSGPGRLVVTARTLVIAGEKREGELLLWRLGSSGDAKSCKLPVPRESALHPMAASADGCVFAAGVGGYENRIIKVWDITGDEARERASLKGEAVPSRIQQDKTGRVISGWPGKDRPLSVAALALAPDGRAVSLADDDGTIQVWSLAEGEPRLRATLPGHHEEGTMMKGFQRLAFSGDGQQLVTVGSDRKLMVWDIASGKAVYAASFPHVLNDAGFAPDGRHVVTSNPDGTVYILQLPRGP